MSLLITTNASNGISPSEQTKTNDTPVKNLKPQTESSVKVEETTNVENQRVVDLNKDLKQTKPSIPQKPLPKAPYEPHPHLDNLFAEPIHKLFNPKEINSGSEQAIINNLTFLKNVERDNDRNIKSAEIDFTQLGLSKSEIRKNHIKGKVWIDNNGKFQVKANGYAGKNFVDAFSAIKEEVRKAAEAAKPPQKNPITLDPKVLGEISSEDAEVLKRGGQIQYRTYGVPPYSGTLKLVLDPGKDGKDDGLTVSIFGKPSSTSKKIPLSVVFGGQEREGKKTEHPLLEDWQKNKYFETSEIKKEYERFIPFISAFDVKTSDNTDDIRRTQAQNTLWQAVNEYLKWTENTEEKGIMAEVQAGDNNDKDPENKNDNPAQGPSQGIDTSTNTISPTENQEQQAHMDKGPTGNNDDKGPLNWNENPLYEAPGNNNGTSSPQNNTQDGLTWHENPAYMDPQKQQIKIEHLPKEQQASISEQIPEQSFSQIHSSVSVNLKDTEDSMAHQRKLLDLAKSMNEQVQKITQSAQSTETPSTKTSNNNEVQKVGFVRRLINYFEDLTKSKNS